MNCNITVESTLLRISMTGQLSGVVQVSCRCSGQLLGEIGLLSLRLGVSQGASLGDFRLAPTCPIEKVTLWVLPLFNVGILINDLGRWFVTVTPVMMACGHHAGNDGL